MLYDQVGVIVVHVAAVGRPCKFYLTYTPIDNPKISFSETC